MNKLTVGDLIKLLKRMPQNMLVTVEGCDECLGYAVDVIIYGDEVAIKRL